MPDTRAAPSASSPPPFGILPRHIGGGALGWGRPLGRFVVIGVPLLAALLGLLGGGAPHVTSVASSTVTLSVEAPRVLRSGNWFETRVIVEPAADIADLTIAVDRPLWRRMSIDTMAPDAEKAESTGGAYAYGFGPVRRGERFVLKLDGQIQPQWLRRLHGRIAVRDGDRPLASVPVSLLVLP